MKTETVSAADFKARCLALLDTVSRSGRSLIVTKRGKPVARVTSMKPVKRRSLKGSILYQEDVVSPIDVDWEAQR